MHAPLKYAVVVRVMKNVLTCRGSDAVSLLW